MGAGKKTNYVVKVEDVDISPDPLKAGKPSTFSIKASTGNSRFLYIDPSSCLVC